MIRPPHWMGEHDYARDLADEEYDLALRQQEYEDERRQDRRAAGLDEEYAPV